MGVVYRAEDTRLGRSVAIKFLSEEIAKNSTTLGLFQREARAASALNHPNVCTIHDVGENDGKPFIVMELLEGQTLKEVIAKGVLPVEKALDLAIQISDGLEHAHANGIFHRDVKPANIFITRDGRVKIVDFGLAKVESSSAQTDLGSSGGTAAYMSPEQVRGDDVDGQSDIYSFGATLYELVTGKHIFHAILDKAPPPPPLELAPVLNKALQKDRRLRYLTARELRADLLRVRRPSRDRGQSIAVLPFTDMSPQRDQEYFCDGMSEELINALAQIDGLHVTSRTSAFALKGQNLDMRSIGEKLGVTAVLEGSVRKSGNKLRVTAQLINIADGFQLWSERYDREMDDVFVIQDDIAQAIVGKLRTKLGRSADSPVIRRYTENPEAYTFYLQGRHYWDRRQLTVAIEWFDKAVALDPDYALAWVGLADCYAVLPAFASTSPSVVIEKGFPAVDRALELDDRLAEAYFSRGLLHFMAHWSHYRAEADYRKALELNPSMPLTHAYLANLLAMNDRPTEAIYHAEMAQRMDPISVSVNTMVATTWATLRRWDRATGVFTKLLEAHPHAPFPLAVYLGVLWHTSRPKELRDCVRRLEKVAGNVPYFLACLSWGYAWLYLLEGDADAAHQARKIIEERKGDMSSDPVYLATTEYYLGNNEKAMEAFEAAYHYGSWMFAYLDHANFDGMRNDPRFQEIFRRVKEKRSQKTTFG